MTTVKILEAGGEIWTGVEEGSQKKKLGWGREGGGNARGQLLEGEEPGGEKAGVEVVHLDNVVLCNLFTVLKTFRKTDFQHWCFGVRFVLS